MDDWLRSLPKVELHLHLEGAIPLDALWILTEKYGAGLHDPAALAERFRYRDFPHFLDVWHWKNQFIREAEDFSFIAESFARSLADQRIVYAEAFFSPTDFRRTGLSPGDIAAALRQGLDRVEGTKVRLIADLVRDNGPTVAGEALTAVSELKDYGIVGVGIGGSEHQHPPHEFEQVFTRARQLGFHTTAHAGEAAGAQSVRDAIEKLRVERIGHGTRATEDPTLLQAIADAGVHIEACPTSNLRTGVCPSLAAHPIKAFLAAGLSVSVNTDDPIMFNCNLAQEYRDLADTFGYGKSQIRTFVQNAIDAAWCSADEKQALTQQLAAC